VLFYRFVRALFRIVALPVFLFRVEGAEHVPRLGPGVVVASHRSWLDPVCVGGACPRPPWARWFYRIMGGIPVPPGGGPYTVTALRGALRVLHEGELIGVFPEGRVFPEDRPGPMHPGAAMLAVRGRAPVIPVVIRGSARAWPHGRSWPGPARVRVHIGPAVVPPAGRDRETVERFLSQIEARLEELAHEASP
jgi:1-acyl-sn-glycerol-3-phosphate acyltransferase